MHILYISVSFYLTLNIAFRGSMILSILINILVKCTSVKVWYSILKSLVISHYIYVTVLSLIYVYLSHHFAITHAQVVLKYFSNLILFSRSSPKNLLNV